MKYIIAIIYTITLVAFPLFIIPFLQWYKLTFCQPNTDLFFIYIILFFISVGMFIMTMIRWVIAIKDDMDINS